MGYKKLSNEEEIQLVKEYIDGTPVKNLMEKYGFATKKSIIDKVKKYNPLNFKELIEQAKNNRKNYSYKLEKIENEFDAYFLGLLLTDGYIIGKDKVGIDLIDKDCIEFLSNSIGKDYKNYLQKNNNMIYRLILNDKELVENLKRFGVVERKTYTITPPKLLKEEEKYIPYIIRGIIDGDGCVSQTSYGGAQFYIVTMSEDFADWIINVLINKLYMNDIHKRMNEKGLWRIETANQYNIFKLIALVYNKPFGMIRKYNKLRKTFRDYNNNAFIE